MQDAPKGKPPRKVKPMLATLVDKPFDRAGWLFEIKWDGYRAIAEVSQGGIRLYSRKQLSFNERYQPVVTALGQLGHEAVLDGEIVVLDGEGKPRFQLLQNYEKTREGQLVYYVFDLLYLDGRDLRSLPLSRRKKILQAILGKSLHVRLSYHVEQKGKLFLQAAKKQGLEGIMAKDGASPYREGKRTHEWLKIKLPEGRLSRPRRTR
jgi:bifunctional non-homologous end joining protein LigD